jgi:hypothetical protein
MLISYLSAQVFFLPFTGIETLLLHSDYQIAVLPESSQLNAFKYSEDPLWKRAYVERIEPSYDSYVDFMKGSKFLEMTMKFRN